MAGTLLFLLVWVNIDNIFDIIPHGEIYEAGKWVVFFIALSNPASTHPLFLQSALPFPHQSLIHSHYRPEVEVLPHTARLIIIDRIVLPPAVRRPQPIVAEHHRRPGPDSLLLQPSAGLPGIIHLPLRSYPQQHVSIVSFDYFHIFLISLSKIVNVFM